MQAMTVESAAPRVPFWLRVVAIVRVLWNLYGVYQCAGTFTQAGQAAMTAGMTPAQAQVYLSLPDWISGAFAIGVAGGLIGSILLALYRHIAGPVLAASLVGYGLLFAGDAYYGVFAVIPGQLAILAVVVLIAAAILWTSRFAGQRGLLH